MAHRVFNKDSSFRPVIFIINAIITYHLSMGDDIVKRTSSSIEETNELSEECIIILDQFYIEKLNSYTTENIIIGE